MPRDEFPKKVQTAVAARAGYICSNPHCETPTSGPTEDPERALSIGVAAHITAASPKGPRYNETLTAKQRKAIDNAIWLCGKCGTLVDRDVDRYPEPVLREWKQIRENKAAAGLKGKTKYRRIADNEVLHGLTIGQSVALSALAEEFGCEVERNVRVQAGGGWFNFHAAVVRGEDLVAIEIYEFKGGGVPYFQVEHLGQVGSQARFDHFNKFILYVAVVSDVNP